MLDPRTWLTGLRKLWVFGSLIALALIWSTEASFFSVRPALQLFAREVAFALLISSVFGLTIEQIQRREFIRLVTEEREVLKRDVFLYAYGNDLPEQIREEIRSSILNQPFQRSDLVIDWEFSPIQDNHELMKVKKRYSYTVLNNSNDKREWPFSFSQIGSDDLKAVADSKFNLLRIKRAKATKEYKREDMKSEQPQDQPHLRKVSTVVAFDPYESVEVYYEILQMRRLYGEDKYNSTHSVWGITKVKLRFPQGAHGFDVTVSCKTKPLQTAADNDPPTVYSFEWNEGILPFQGVTVSWSKKEELKPGEISGGELPKGSA